MLDIGRLSICYFLESLISNNQVKLKLLALDEIIQIECSVIILMIIENQDEEVMDNGNIVEVIHEYRALNPKELESNILYNYNAGDFCHVIDIYGDYVIKIICNEVNVVELGTNPYV